MKLTRSSVYRRYLKYYGFIFILPVAILVLVIGLIINRMYVGALMDGRQQTVTRIARTLDNSLGAINVMSAKLASANIVRSEYLKRSPMKVMEAQRQLREMVGASSLLSDIVIRIIDGGFVLTCNSGSAGERWSESVLESARAFSVRHLVPRHAEHPRAELNFVLNKWFIRQYVATEIDISSEAFEIWDGDRLMFCAGQTRGDDFSFPFDSGMSSWQYRYLTPRSPILVSERMVYLYLLGGLLLICALGLMLVIRFARLTYGPVEKIDSYIRALYPVDARYGRDEFDRMYEALCRLHEDDSVLRERAELMKDAYLAMRLMSLIKGEVQTETEAARLIQDIRPLKGGRQLVALVRASEGGVLHGLPESLATSGIDAYFVPLMEMGYVALLVVEREMGEAMRMLESISRTFKLRVGVGNGYEQMVDASRSYMEAQAAFLYATDRHPVIGYRELEQRSESHRYPYREINRVTAALQARDELKIGEAMNELCVALRRQVLPISIMRCICYDVINCVIKLSIDLTNQQGFPRPPS